MPYAVAVPELEPVPPCPCSACRGQELNVEHEQVVVVTPRGNLTVGPEGKLEGLWRIVSRDLRTHAQVVKMTGATPNTVRSWRRSRDFPGPVLHFTGKGGRLELWSRTEVESWLETHASQWTLAHRLARERP